MVRVAAEASDFEIEESGVDGVAKCRRWLRGATIAEHALIPCFAGKFVGFLASLSGALSRRSDRTAVNGFSGFGAHGPEGCASDAGIGKPLDLAGRNEANPRGRPPLEG